MRRLVIHLQKVDKVFVENKKTKKSQSKIFNTLNIPVNSDQEIVHHLSVHDGNIKSHRVKFY